MICALEMHKRGKMPNHIHLLSEETINQIAAGEVIENPASVVKELIENSVDAKADRVIVEIQRGGFQKIVVSDNGKGMSWEDMRLCLTRHTTSKINHADDLQSTLSMGFRGEALASICAVSKLSITSSQGGDGCEIVGACGKIKSVQAAARNRGTTVEVHELFHNVLPRMKFQKSALSSQNEILKIVTKLSLAYPLLELKCLVDGREMLFSGNPQSQDKKKALEQVIEAVLKDGFLSDAAPLFLREGECEAMGFVGAPNQARKSRTGQYLFVNARCVQSAEINQFVHAGYSSRLPPRVHPTFVLHLTLPPHWVDVNVHPQKKEIRLLKTADIEQLLCRGILKAFREEETKGALMTGHTRFERGGNWDTNAGADFMLREEKKSVIPSLFPKDLPVIALFFHYLMLDAKSLALPMVGSEGVVLVDLQLSEQSIAFETFLERFEKRGEMQSLLCPVTFACSAYEKEQILQHLKTLKQMGIAIRPFGEKVFVIDAIDPYFDKEHLVDLVYEIIAVLEGFGNANHLEQEQKKILALKAIRFASFQKKDYSMEQGHAIVKKLFQMPSSHRGPAGESTYIYLSRDAIKKFFL